MHCTYESFRTMLGKVDRLYFPKCTHHLFQKFSFQNAERHEAPSRTKKKVRFSLKFIHHPILKTLICATFEKRHIMEKLDSDLSKKRLSPNWQSTSSYPHTYHCYCCSIKHLELRLHTSLRLIVWHVCDCYVFFSSFFQSFCLTATSTRSTGWRACTGRRGSGIFSPVQIGRLEGGDKSLNIID